jgi:Flp pilus assembly protein TadD
MTTTPMADYDACVDLQQNGNITEAFSALNKLTENFPDFSLAYNALAAIYKKKGDDDNAIRCMEKYCELEPDDSFGFSVLSSYCLSAGRRSQAEEALGKATELRFKYQFD